MKLKSKYSLKALVSGALLLTLGSLPAGCLNRPVGVVQPQTTNILVDQLVQSAVDKIDLLFVIDNSISMADKQKILALALPDLVDRFVSPICIDSDGNEVDHPASAKAECISGAREFKPIEDIHIGVVTTSLGAYGAPIDCTNDAAKDQSIQTVDMAHLVGSLARGGGTMPGFLAWNAASARDVFVGQFADQVAAAGEFGCGWEASLESWYRFLVEPYPYTKVVRQNCPFGNDTNKSCIGPETNPEGQVLVDQVILNQRKQFLRPDSLMAVIMLSDENDCSFRASGQSWRLAQALNEGEPRTINQAFRGTTACQTDTNDVCCHSCGAAPPPSCQAEQNEAGEGVGLGCAAGRKYPVATVDVVSDDAINLRCYQQKRRFGVDYLYPVERYSNALTLATICPFADDLDPLSELCVNPEDATQTLTVPNPLYDDLSFEERFAADPAATRAFPRPPNLVFLAGIVGVPWQDLAQTVGGALDPNTPLKYRINTQTEDDANLRVNWQWLVGDNPSPGGIPNPTDPLMIESVEARTGLGTNPVTGEAPAGPESPDPNANSINGHEWTIVDRNDLQYACTFPIQVDEPCIDSKTDQERRLAGEAVPNCDCTDYSDETTQNPLCQVAGGGYGLQQFAAKAYPSIRQLEVLRNYGENSIVASICPKETNNVMASDFGYRPAVGAIVDALKAQLSDKCLPRPLATKPVSAEPNAPEVVQCRLIEARKPAAGEAATCDLITARLPVEGEIERVVRNRLLTTNICANKSDCQGFLLCEIEQLLPPANVSCLNDVSAPQGDGWCYVDPARGLGAEAIVEGCDETEQRKIRFAGDGTPDKGTVTFFACAGESLDEESGSGAGGDMPADDGDVPADDGDVPADDGDGAGGAGVEM